MNAAGWWVLSQALAYAMRAKLGRVRLGKAVEGEGDDGPDDVVGRLPRDPPLAHARSQACLDGLHPLLRALEAHGPAQLLGLATGEAAHGHRHPQELLLEQRHPEGSLQDRLEQRVRVGDRLEAVSPAQVRVHHLAHDGAGPDDGHLDHEVVEALGLHAGQRGHLRPALHLEDPHRVGPAEPLVDLRVVRRQVGQVDLDPRLPEHRDGVLQSRHHAQAQEIDLDDPQVRAVFLVPLDHDAPGHRRGLEGNHLVEPPWAITIPPECWPR